MTLRVAQAEEQEQRRRWLAAQDDEDNRAEIYNHVTGDFLTESKDQALSTRGPERPLAGRYKGMTSEELKIIRDEQARQMGEIQVRERLSLSASCTPAARAAGS